MRKSLLIITALLCLPVIAFCQAPSIQWEHCYGYGLQHGDEAGYLLPIGDTAYYVTGLARFVPGYEQGDFDAWMAKIDTAGHPIWQRAYGGPEFDGAGKTILTADGGYLLAGGTESTGGEVSGYHPSSILTPDIWLVKLDSSGAIQWERAYGGSSTDGGGGIIPTYDGGYVFTATTSSFDGDVTGNHGGYDEWVVKINATGAIVWQHCFGGSGYDGATGIIQTADSGLMVVGWSGSDDGDVSFHYGPTVPISLDGRLMKLDQNGQLQWQKIYGGTGSDQLVGITAVTGGYILTGSTTSNDGDVSGNHGGDYDAWVFRINDTGQILWQRCYGGTGQETLGPPKLCMDQKSFIFCGSTSSNDGDASGNNGLTDGWVVKTDTSGNLLWQEEIGSTDNDRLGYIIQTADSGYIACGASSGYNECSNSGMGDDAWIVRLGKDALGIPNTEFKNHIKVFPTVTTGTITIEYPATIAKPAIHLYNSVGQQVPFSMADNGAGKTVTITNQPEGIYLLQVRGVGGSATFRILYRP